MIVILYTNNATLSLAVFSATIDDGVFRKECSCKVVAHKPAFSKVL